MNTYPSFNQQNQHLLNQQEIQMTSNVPNQQFAQQAQVLQAQSCGCNCQCCKCCKCGCCKCCCKCCNKDDKKSRRKMKKMRRRKICRIFFFVIFLFLGIHLFLNFHREHRRKLRDQDYQYDDQDYQYDDQSYIQQDKVKNFKKHKHDN